jgi:hypothetical protein
VSEFHPILCFIAQKSRLGRKDLFFCTRTLNSYGRTGQVRSTNFSLTFDDCFERNLLIVSLIDSILLLLAS